MNMSLISLIVQSCGTVMVMVVGVSVREQIHREYIYIYIYIYIHTHTHIYIYRVIRNDCRGSNNLSYTIHLRKEYMCFLFNRTTLQVFVTYLTGALYVHLL